MKNSSKIKSWCFVYHPDGCSEPANVVITIPSTKCPVKFWIENKSDEHGTLLNVLPYDQRSKQ